MIKHFYVTVIDGSKVYYMAGPYENHDDAKAKVDIVRNICCDENQNSQYAKAWFMAYGTASSTQEIKTRLGKL